MTDRTHTTRFNRYRAYRDRVVEFHKRFGITKFTNNMQFWTLGGIGHDEFKELRKHLEFDRGSYHSVDRGKMSPAISDAMVLHNCEFSAATSHNKGWRNVIAISFDSTCELVCHNDDFHRHDGKFQNLIGLSRSALNRSEHNLLFVHSNWMLAHPQRRRTLDTGLIEQLSRDYSRWVQDFCNEFECDGMKVIPSKFSSVEQMTKTYMVDMHFLIKR